MSSNDFRTVDSGNKLLKGKAFDRWKLVNPIDRVSIVGGGIIFLSIFDIQNGIVIYDSVNEMNLVLKISLETANEWLDEVAESTTKQVSRAIFFVHM